MLTALFWGQNPSLLTTHPARPFVADFRLGGLPQDLSSLDSLLSDSKIWGVDLFEAGLADLVKDYFRQLCAGTGAVERTLEKALG